jgi:uncharacterized spore protein YtfJ
LEDVNSDIQGITTKNTLSNCKEEMVEDIEKLVETSMGEIEKVLSSKAVVGEPIVVEGNTIIPLMTIGFAFGAGGGSGKGIGKGDGKGRGAGEGSGEGIGEGTGGGGGIRPTALIIINQDGVRVEPVKGGTSSVLEKFGDAMGKAVERCAQKKEE